MFENFLKTGDPSTEDVEWKPYNTETGCITLLNTKTIECMEGRDRRIRAAASQKNNEELE